MRKAGHLGHQSSRHIGSGGGDDILSGLGLVILHQAAKGWVGPNSVFRLKEKKYLADIVKHMRVLTKNFNRLYVPNWCAHANSYSCS